jgi:hypothetical protein
MHTCEQRFCSLAKTDVLPRWIDSFEALFYVRHRVCTDNKHPSGNQIGCELPRSRSDHFSGLISERFDSLSELSAELVDTFSQTDIGD